ncbi:hypothetical protein DENIS_4136 [Desulfonema ishimotonii]|uniref:Outer membrane protein beta-barrel domain-containing protein n=1 Tax=Desulfonema ishimotonii TaxID=45657 RepID=A0A401G1T1_9BACT|nr:hypothetical protein [Desulfonema ishimotonii]GBC63143.1 hypothetical protein DENIS_4136 [Desulfonema ishimotonii]
MKRIIGFVTLMVCLSAAAAHAGGFNIDVNVNQSVLEARAGGEWAADPSTVSAGIGILYDEDDYTLGAADLSIGNPIFIPDLIFGMGLRGLWGEVEKDSEDGDMAAVALMLSAVYEPIQLMDVPLEITGQLCGALSPMCFQDSDGYLEFKTTVGLYVLKERKGVLYTGYRYLNIRFDDDFSESDLTDNSVFLGIKFRF